MRYEDLRAGDEYALPTYEPGIGVPQAARVRLVSADGGGMATVLVVEPGPKPPVSAYGAKSFKADETLQVSTRRLICPWNQWEARAAASRGAVRAGRAAEAEASRAAHARERRDRIAIRPERVLPDAYEQARHERFDLDVDADEAEREALSNAYVKVRGLGPQCPPQQVRALLGHLPVPVLRDILAADRHGRPGEPGSVAAVFARAASLIEAARLGMQATMSFVLPTGTAGWATEADVEFVHAIEARVAAGGGRLSIPPVPALPEWVDERARAIAPVFGWLRLALASTEGNRLHAAGCRSVRFTPVAQCAHRPWWSIMLEDGYSICGRCHGPAPRDLVALAGFAAASDVWQARGRRRIEEWQQQAFQHLIAASAEARAQVCEPDITLAHRVVGAFAEHTPGEVGWDAYGLGAAEWWHGPARTAQALGPAEREAARVLLRERVAVLERVLPEANRLPALDAAAEVDALRRRYAEVKTLLGDLCAWMPPIDKLVFTLPNAMLGV